MNANGNPLNVGYTTRVKIAVLILVLATLVTVVTSLSRIQVTAGIAVSRTEAYGRRFDRLRDSLPERGVVGYIGLPDDTTLWGLRRSRYFLAPLLVDHSTNHDLIVGNFDTRPVSAEWLASRGLRLARDFGDGVMLLTPVTR